MKRSSLALALLLAATAAAAQGLPKPLADYKFAQSDAFSKCSFEMDLARINADTARITRTSAPYPSTVALGCIQRAEADVKARYTALAAGMPERDRAGLVDIQVAWVTAIRGLLGERSELAPLRAKFDEAWNRWEATH